MDSAIRIFESFSSRKTFLSRKYFPNLGYQGTDSGPDRSLPNLTFEKVQGFF